MDNDTVFNLCFWGLVLSLSLASAVLAHAVLVLW